MKPEATASLERVNLHTPSFPGVEQALHERALSDVYPPFARTDRVRSHRQNARSLPRLL